VVVGGRDLSAVIDGMVKDATFACISDRTLEHLAPSDRVIVVTRRCLLDATQALHDNGSVPPLVDDPGITTRASLGRPDRARG
jgi:hypothetical protein